jgi:hypothetical protein
MGTRAAFIPSTSAFAACNSFASASNDLRVLVARMKFDLYDLRGFWAHFGHRYQNSAIVGAHNPLILLVAGA